MPLHLVDVSIEYAKDKNLKKEDVQSLIEWTQKQPHLPSISELQAILFLHSCYFRNEAAKKAIETYFRTRTSCPDLFKGRNPSLPPIKSAIDNTLATILPKKTPEGYTIIYLKLINTDPEYYNMIEQIKYLDMVCSLQLYQEGTSNGFVIVADHKGVVFGHFTKVLMAGPTVLKNFFFYLQEGLPVRLKGLHFINNVPFVDKILALVKPLMKMELLDLLHFHRSVEDLAKFVPLNCLPGEYGGGAENSSVLHEKAKSKYLANVEFFEWEEKQIMNQSKRPEKARNSNDGFGIEGTFKKLEID